MKKSRPDLVDLTHTVYSGMKTYPGLPSPIVTDYISHETQGEAYAPGVSFHIGHISMIANSGTAIDTPYHRFKDLADIANFPLECVADIEGIVIRIDCKNSRSIDESSFEGINFEGLAVLIQTNHSLKWGEEGYFKNHPFLCKNAALYLKDNGAKLVAIDSLNIDDTSDPERPAHTILLAAGIAIVENIGYFQQLPDTGFYFTAAPMKIKGMSTSPVRAWARIKSN